MESHRKEEEISARYGESFFRFWSKCTGALQEVKFVYHRLDGADKPIHARIDAENWPIQSVRQSYWYKHGVAETTEKFYSAPRSLFGPYLPIVCKALWPASKSGKEDLAGAESLIDFKQHSREELKTDSHRHPDGHPPESLAVEKFAPWRRLASTEQFGATWIH